MKFTAILKFFVLWRAAIIIVTIAAQYSLLALAGDLFGSGTQGYVEKPWVYSPGELRRNALHLLPAGAMAIPNKPFFPLSDHHDPHHDHPRSQPTLSSPGFLFRWFFLAGLFLFTKLALLDYSPTVVKWTVLALLIFPPPVSFSPYTPRPIFLTIAAFSPPAPAIGYRRA